VLATALSRGGAEGTEVRRAATIEDVAREAGVSRQTVSNVLNTPAIVRETTRERVQEAIARLRKTDVDLPLQFNNLRD